MFFVPLASGYVDFVDYSHARAFARIARSVVTRLTIFGRVPVIEGPDGTPQ